MKKLVPGWALLLFGAFLLAAALVGKFWAPGYAERVPLDINTTTYLTGQVDKLNVATGQVEHNPVKVTSITKTDPKRSDHDVAAWVSVTCVNVNVDNPPDCLTDSDPRMITDSLERFATDRHSGMAVNDSKYVQTDTKYKGLLNKFPFKTQRSTYQIWDGTAGSVAEARYIGTESVQGLKVYRFDTKIADAPIELGPGIAGVYNLTKTMLVEPWTGAIIDQKQRDVRTLENGDTALDMSIAFTPATVKSNVDDAKANVANLKLLTEWVPLLGFILGPLALLVGALLVLSSRRKVGQDDVNDGGRRRTEPSPA